MRSASGEPATDARAGRRQRRVAVRAAEPAGQHGAARDALEVLRAAARGPARADSMPQPLSSVRPGSAWESRAGSRPPWMTRRVGSTPYFVARRPRRAKRRLCSSVVYGADGRIGAEAGAARSRADHPPPAGATAHRLRHHLPRVQPAREVKCTSRSARATSPCPSRSSARRARRAGVADDHAAGQVRSRRPRLRTGARRARRRPAHSPRPRADGRSNYDARWHTAGLASTRSTTPISPPDRRRSSCVVLATA